jgi:hypothetical protein
MVGKLLQARNGEAEVAVASVGVRIGVAVAVTCIAAGEAVQVGGSFHAVG